MNINNSVEKQDTGAKSVKKYPTLTGKNDKFTKSYSNRLQCVLKSIPLNDINCISTVTEAEDYVNKASTEICDVIHNVCEESVVDCKVKSRKKQNQWWNIDCTAAKNRNKVWFNIWKQCGRPKSGQVYKCYKLAKYKFRRMCRSAVNQVNRNKYEMLSTLQSSKKVGQLWNNIQTLRKANTIQQNDYIEYSQ